jgi:hypothetical protein
MSFSHRPLSQVLWSHSSGTRMVSSSLQHARKASISSRDLVSHSEDVPLFPFLSSNAATDVNAIRAVCAEGNWRLITPVEWQAGVSSRCCAPFWGVSSCAV